MQSAICLAFQDVAKTKTGQRKKQVEIYACNAKKQSGKTLFTIRWKFEQRNLLQVTIIVEQHRNRVSKLVAVQSRQLTRLSLLGWEPWLFPASGPRKETVTICGILESPTNVRGIVLRFGGRFFFCCVGFVIRIENPYIHAIRILNPNGHKKSRKVGG